MGEQDGQKEAAATPPAARGAFDINLNVTVKNAAEVVGSFERMWKSLIATVRAGVGRAFTPVETVANAYADRQAMLVRADTVVRLGEMRERSSSGEAKVTLEQRAIDRLLAEAVAQQDAREWIANEAIREIESNPPASDAEREIDPGWAPRFWRAADDTPEEEARRSLAHVLASEVKRPGSVSPQTLQVLAILPGDVARRFQHFCRFSIDDGKDVYVIHPSVFMFQNIGPLKEYGVSYDDLFEFDDCRLLRSAKTQMLNYAENPEASPERVDCAGREALLNLSGKQVQLLQFTSAGKEIRRLLSLSPVPAYTQVLQERLGAAFTLMDDTS